MTEKTLLTVFGIGIAIYMFANDESGLGWMYLFFASASFYAAI